MQQKEWGRDGLEHMKQYNEIEGVRFVYISLSLLPLSQSLSRSQSLFLLTTHFSVNRPRLTHHFEGSPEQMYAASMVHRELQPSDE